ncbi:PREDICTED: vesicle-fusing ATPase 1-like [Trachymyrmex septentrionalis]|uniref:vesicle-fusing ATPase 1-like n=1 Tax=Trachymyrmex septentrionalis TaxID=34720 RepID=UPI00084EDAFF|nr:PREDICTED: vesicle-fusing ATPase 1-like [Trachymyrmex septentrionalis]
MTITLQQYTQQYQTTAPTLYHSVLHKCSLTLDDSTMKQKHNLNMEEELKLNKSELSSEAVESEIEETPLSAKTFSTNILSETVNNWLNFKLNRNIITWGTLVTEILEGGNLCIKVARATGFFSVLLVGLPKTGKTTLAAQIAKNSNFPFIKIITPEDIINLDEFDNDSAKCRFIQKAFDEAYRSQLSCILIDNIERLVNYCPLKSKYSILILQTLFVLLEKSPPPGHKLLILCTSSCQQFLIDVELILTFNTTFYVPTLSTVDHMLNVLDEVNLFSKHKMASFRTKLQGKQRIFIGIKKLLCLIDIVRQVEPSDRVEEFFIRLLDEGGLQ